MKKSLIFPVIFIILFCTKALFCGELSSQEIEIIATKVLRSIYDKTSEIEKDYPYLNGFKSQAIPFKAEGGENPEFILRFSKDVDPTKLSKSNPFGILLNQYSCLFEVGIRKPRKDEQRQVSFYRRYFGLNLGVYVIIYVSSKEMSIKLHEIIFSNEGLLQKLDNIIITHQGPWPKKKLDDIIFSNLGSLEELKVYHSTYPDDIRIPMGLLGYPLGTYLTIEGVRADILSKKAGYSLLVDMINGKKLETPVGVRVENMTTELPEKTRCILRGYESGRMIGIPYEVSQKENIFPSQFAAWGFHRYFIVTSVVEPKELKTEKTSQPFYPSEAKQQSVGEANLPKVIFMPDSKVAFLPGLQSDVFFYNNFWWSQRGNQWYRSSNYNGPWETVYQRNVPTPVSRVPKNYRSIYEKQPYIPYPDWAKGWSHKSQDNRNKPGQ